MTAATFHTYARNHSTPMRIGNGMEWKRKGMEGRAPLISVCGFLWSSHSVLGTDRNARAEQREPAASR